MANPTVTSWTRQVGRKGMTLWHSLSSDATNWTDKVIVDLSALLHGYTNNLTIERIVGRCTAGVEFTLEIDCTTDQLVYNHPLGSIEQIDVDFTWGGREGVVKTAAGATGDLVITTLNAAAADEIMLIIYWKAS